MTRKRRGRASDARVTRLYNKRAKDWGEAYLLKRFWRIRSMYDYEDVAQDAFDVYLGVYRRHPGRSENELLKIYRCTLWGRVQNRSRQCFPNTHAYEKDKGKLVLDINDCEETYLIDHEAATILRDFSDLLLGLPNELAEVLKLLIGDFLGVSCIEQRKARRLSGTMRLEPLGKALARKVGVDPSRDLFEELSEAFANRQLTKDEE